MKKVFLFFILISIFLTSCKKFLTSTPQDFNTPETFYLSADQATIALNSGLVLLLNGNWWGGAFNSRALESGDDAYATLSGYPANFSVNFTDPLFTNNWNVVYQCIERMNLLLANIDNGDYDITKKNIIRGEALFLRAYSYFHLVSLWGPVPLRLKPTGDGALDKNLARSPIAEVYAQITKDMITADSLVPAASTAGYGCNGYPSKTTVQAMLARVYLKMASAPLHDISKYEEAKTWGMKVINSGLHSLNPSYSQVFINMISNQYDKQESLWEVDAMDVPAQNLHSNVGYLDGIAYGPVDSGTGAGQVRCNRIFYNLYNAKDLRRDWSISPFQYGTNGAHVNYTATQLYDRFPGKFRLNYSPFPRNTGRTPVNFPLMRYADVLLMVAEAENAISGPTALAYSLINQVRRRGWGKMLPGATNPSEADLPAGLSKADFQQEIQDERSRELSSEGLRKHDLIRWGILVQTFQKMKADVTDPGKPNAGTFYINTISAYANNVSLKDTLFPIPASEMQLNNLATQNPGW